MELGKAKSGTWRTNGNELCMVRGTRKREFAEGVGTGSLRDT